MDAYSGLELIGKGSYGKVYKVKSKGDGDAYVMKKVPVGEGSAGEAEASLREANVLQLLRHPHIVPYKEFFHHEDGDLCLVMAYCEQGDLYKHIKHMRQAGKSVDEGQAWRWLVQLLLALQYCHSKKILHRDVKTQNIFMSEGKLMLGDFGLAKQLQRTLEMARTPIGTPFYMAPEIYEEQPYSFKSDVWALGCVMYEMLAGKPAFAADNLSRVVIRVIRGNYDPLPESYSPELRDVVCSMLCKVVKKRPDSSDLLQHPFVVQHVKRYLDELSNLGPNGGWSTWRMKLPPAMLAQMASVISRSRPTSAFGTQGPADSPAAKSDDDNNTGGAGRGISRHFEDMMTSSELIEGFGLESLLLDDKPPAGGAGRQEHSKAASTLAGDPRNWEGLPELQLLQKQLHHIKV